MDDRKDNYIITNVLCIYSHEDIIKNDLEPFINSKYPLHFLHSNEFETIIKSEFKSDGIYVDGFDILFDKATMK
jgi:hypothetical protein